jgi:predicted Zn-dependent protease
MPAPRTVLKHVTASLLFALALVYLLDWAVVSVRALHPTATSPYETMTVPRILAIPENNGKTEYQIDQLHPEESVTCVHALFPHSGHGPCWYVRRKISQPVPM